MKKMILKNILSVTKITKTKMLALSVQRLHNVFIKFQTMSKKVLAGCLRKVMKCNLKII